MTDNILTYGAEIGQVLGNLISTLLANEMDFFKDRFEYLGQTQMRKKVIKIMGIKEKPDVIDVTQDLQENKVK